MSTAESQLRRLVDRQHGVVGWSQARALGLTARQSDRRTAAGVLVVVRIDLADPQARVGIEGDRRRGNLLAARGWTILRFGWDDVRRRGDRVAGDVRAVLGRRLAG